MAGMPSDARIIIKVEVNDADAKRKLNDLGRRLKQLDRDGKKTNRSLDDTGKSLERAAKSADKLSKKAKEADDKLNWFGKRLKQVGKDLDGVGLAFKSFRALLSGVFKILKYGAVEFAALTAVLGAFKLALAAGQVVARAWTATVKAMGGAAGVAVAGIATVLGAIRELQVAQMKPLYTGPLTAGLDMSMLLGNKRLAMYSESLNAIAAEQMRATGRIDAQFQQRLVRLGDFAAGDPKTLQSIAAAFSQMQKQGKVTTDVYGALQKASPPLAKAFEELAGGQKKAERAAAKGTITFEQFNKAVLEGNLEALKPYAGALDEINNTLIGRLKGTLTVVKEEFTNLGLDFVDVFKGPLALLETDLRVFLMKVAPTLRSVFPQLMGGAAGEGENMLSRLLDRLATSINTNMGSLVGMGSRLAESWGRFREVMRNIGDYLQRMSGPFDTLWNTIVKPFGQELATTFNFALESFGLMVEQNSGSLRSMGESIRGIFEGVRGLIKMLSTFKQIIQPFVNGLLKFASMFGQVFGASGIMGAFLRFVGIGGILILLFKKFVVSLGAVKQNTTGFWQSLKNLAMGLPPVKAGSDAAAEGLKKQGKEAAITKVQIDLLNQSLTRMIELLELIIALSGRMRTAGVGQIAIGPAGNPGALPGKGPLALPPGPKAPLAIGPTGDPGALKILANRYPQKLGDEQAKGFKAGLKKYGAGATIATGMIATLGGTYISGRSSATSGGMQALGAGLSGAGMGASMGMMFGPYGALAGALLGGGLGAISGFLGAKKERARRRQQGRDAAAEQVASALGTGNRLEDFIAARDAAKAGLADVEFMKTGGKARIAELEKKRDAASQRMMADFSAFAAEELAKRGLLEKGAKLRFLASGQGTGVFDQYGTEITASGRDAFYREGESTALKVGGKKADVELDVIEEIARMFAVQKLGENEADVLQRTIGRGDSKNAFFLKDIVEGRFNDEIAHTNKLMGELRDKYGDAYAAGDKYKEELSNIAEKQERYYQNSEFAARAMGVETEDVAKLFDELGMSLYESGVGINEFTKLIGYTGNAAADAATAMGRLRDRLLGGVEAVKERAESEQRLRGQLTAYFETRGNPMSKTDKDIMSADTVTALVENQLARLQTGEISWQQLFGGGTATDSPLGIALGGASTGLLSSQFDALIAESEKRGLDPELIKAMKDAFSGIRTQYAEVNKDPFERAKVDSVFAKEFQTRMNLASRSAMEAITGGKPAAEALDEAVGGLEGFLKQNGIPVTDETLANLSTTLGNTVLNSSMAIEAAFQDGAELAYQAIRAALSGGTYLRSDQVGTGMPGIKVTDGTGMPGIKPKEGDTASDRFRRTMSAHASMNGRFGGRRTVTSGVRNWNLGSLSSDHLTGAAFDLTGDNLLAYGKSVRDSGGFAEMHGGPDNRHLHVVPRTGDSYSPRPAGSGQSAPMAVASGPITVNVYANEGQSVQAIADEVIDRIDRRDRSMRERY